MAQKILDEWDTLVSLLPANWEQLAIDHKQLLVQHGNAKITNASDLLRLILVRAAADLPLRQTVALVAQAGGPTLSPMLFHKKMIRASNYLHALVTAMVDTPMGLAPEKWAGYVVSAVDATVVSRPGSVNGDARIHCRMRLGDLKYLQIRSTGIVTAIKLLPGVSIVLCAMANLVTDSRCQRRSWARACPCTQALWWAQRATGAGLRVAASAARSCA